MNYIWISILIIILLIVFLIITVLLKNKNPTFNKHSIVSTVLYLIEAVCATTVLIYLFGVSDEKVNFFDIFRNYVFCFAVYNGFFYFTIRMHDSLTIDSLSTMKTKIELYTIHAEFKRKIPEDSLKKDIEGAMNDGISFTTKNREELRRIVEMCQLYNENKIEADELRFWLKQKTAMLDHEIRFYGFTWMNSILLRIFR
ncbi:hypothetical protein [Bacillus haynesii]|uniref:hypothetical protein n=1 Tax=Bacillus haynesii TaxID=1925021 RepID=UPI00227E0F77|nr:hypothetical protein [Bacillus haynesii]MCY9156276.1 hypothetical protein [Bacillus haynesii]MCY9450361.1 hypothetical protein [Bacillus haynesii]